MSASARDVVTEMLASEAGKARKLEILFGPWWRHYAVPYEFPATLYSAQSSCPYCAGPLGPLPILEQDDAADGQSAHLDHMDPLSRGGEDSIRNAIYVCRNCNLAKGRRLFSDWLERLAPDRRDLVRLLYTEKHGHEPEAFVPGRKQARLSLPRLELSLHEAVLRKMFAKPIVSGPPGRR